MKRHFFSIACVAIFLLMVWNFGRSFYKLEQVGLLELEKKPTIVIDAGHGGEDGGTSSALGDLEKDINLSISLYLQEILEENGYTVVMTRETDTDLGDSSLSTVAERKTSDMQNRLEIINSSSAVLGVSIHQNYFEQTQYSGAQVFYSDEQSQSLAQNIQASLVENLDSENNRVATEIENKYILDQATMPMVIVECGFLSNEEEASLLASEDYQMQVAMAIYLGIINELEIASNYT